MLRLVTKALPVRTERVSHSVFRTLRGRRASPAEVAAAAEARKDDFYQSIEEADKQPEISKEALEHYYKASGTIFSSNPSQAPSMKKIWQSTRVPRQVVSYEFRRFEDLLVHPDVTVLRSSDPPPVFESRDILPVHTVVFTLLSQYASSVVVLEQDKATRNYADYVVLATGRSSRHLHALAQAIRAEGRTKLGRVPRIAELSVHRTDSWVIVTTNHVVVHLLLRETRTEMDLEDVWMPRQHRAKPSTSPRSEGSPEAATV